MNYRIILFILCAFLLSSCSENETNKPQAKPEEKKETIHNDTAVTPKEAFSANSSAPEILEYSFDIEPMDFVLGNADSKVTLMEYSSPTCPHCSYFHKEILPKLKKKYIDTGKILYVLREFVVNKQDLDAAVMGRCYQNEEDPLKLINLLYVQQEAWAFNKNYREILTNMGGLAGVSREKYLECLSDKKIIDFLLKHAKNISSYPGFIGTPAFFVNGIMYKGAYSVEGMSGIIDAEFKKIENDSKEPPKQSK